MSSLNHFTNKRVAGNIGRSSANWWTLLSHLWAGRPQLETCSESQREGALFDSHSGVQPAVGAPNLSNICHSRQPSVTTTPEPAFDGNTAEACRVEKAKEPFTWGNQLRRTILSSWINVLILAAPPGIALSYIPWANRIVVFVVNFVAIIPLAAMLGFATEEVALRTSETLGGLINATFGNAVELIVAIIALRDNKVDIVKTSLIGSVLSNLLLVTGFCFLFGGWRRPEQHFNSTFAQTAASLLIVAAASVTIPSVLSMTTPDIDQKVITRISRGTCVILLLIYVAYLIFQLHTHQEHFKVESQKVAAKPRSGIFGSAVIKNAFAMPSAVMCHALPDQTENRRLSTLLRNRDIQNQDSDEAEDPKLHFFVALAALVLSTVIIAFCAESMVASIDSVTEQAGLTRRFVGLILLPIVGNAAEHATAVTVAMKDKMDLAISVAVGSSLQVALFLIPLLVIIGWAMNKVYMDLSFEFFQIAVLLFAVLLTNSVTADNSSHWLEGYVLVCIYSIIAVCAFIFPDTMLDKANSS